LRRHALAFRGLLRQEAADGGLHGRAGDPRAGPHGRRVMEAEAALALLESRGFDEAQVTLSTVRQDEVNIAQGEPNLMRSTDASRLALVGILGGRRASTELSDLDEDAVRAAVDGLLAAARAAPVDAANRVSSGQ